VNADLDVLALQVERLEERRSLAAWCLSGCLTGVASVKVERDGIACRCRPGPNVGVVPVVASVSPLAGRGD
jgi:hypothetical protein